jgi:hypothetical protein
VLLQGLSAPNKVYDGLNAGTSDYDDDCMANPNIEMGFEYVSDSFSESDRGSEGTKEAFGM